ncbi:MAG: hypothetical protein JRJ19_10185 [Deltaproteobacteria bacterium]|nr:hypothetical protein [Deltaproteobacteria bacterium]MBW1872424.1 hypothetical protein [Deltaproteobacteria bacterium]
MKKTIYTLVCVGVALFGRNAFGYIQTTNQRLDHAIYANHDPKLIVAGEIVETDVKPRPSAIDGHPADVSFRFKVSSVILGKQSYKGQTIVVPATTFMWPSNLLAFTKGVKCALIMRTDWGEKRNGFYLESVVPVSRLRLPSAKDGEQAKRILETEILAQLKDEKGHERQRALLMQVAPILTKKNAAQVAPFVSSKDVWLKRAALAALIYATEGKEYIRKAAKDVQLFVSSTKTSDLIGGTYAAYPYFFDHYFFLEKRSWTFGSRWDEQEASRNLRIVNAMFGMDILSDEVKKILKGKKGVK